MTSEKRFTGRQITTMVVALAIAIVGFPVGVWAATTTTVVIADPAHPARKAQVSSTGRLLVDAAGSVRPAPPADTWRYANPNLAGISGIVLGPTSKTVNVTSLTVSTQTNGSGFTLSALRVAGTATDCSAVEGATVLYSVTNLAIGAPLTAAFPTPLQVQPASGKKVCLWIQAPAMAVDLSGYYGS